MYNETIGLLNLKSKCKNQNGRLKIKKMALGVLLKLAYNLCNLGLLFRVLSLHSRFGLLLFAT